MIAQQLLPLFAIEDSPWNDVLACGTPKPVADAIHMSAMWQTAAITQRVDLILHLRKELTQTREALRVQGQQVAKLQNDMQLQTAVLAQILRGEHTLRAAEPRN